MGKKILILSGCKFPEGDAGSVRIFSLVKLFGKCGLESVVIGKGTYAGKNGQRYDDVLYYSFRSKSTDIVHKVADRVSYKKRLKSFLEKFGGEFSYFLVVDIPFSAIDYAVAYAKKNKISLLHDSLEWYSPGEFKFGRLNPLYIHRDLLNRFKITKKFNVIAISTYLENYFRNKGCNTIRIPAILSADIIENENSIKDKIVVTYVGFPERKDKLIDILEAYTSLEDSCKDRIELHIVGVTMQQIRELYKLNETHVDAWKNKIKFYGRVPREQALLILRNAHFTILYRNAKERYAMAGFPTKVAESTSMGIPIVTNLSSDLGMYLHDGFNSIVIEDTKNGIAKALQRAATISIDEYDDMKKNVISLYESSFYYEAYKEQCDEFINLCLEKQDEKSIDS